MPVVTHSPFRFPLEVEREIFELAATTGPHTAATLLRVSRYALLWIQPVLYKTVLLRDAYSSKLFRQALAGNFGSLLARVTTLYLPNKTPIDIAAKVMAACPSVQNLACWTHAYDDLYTLCRISHLRPKRITFAEFEPYLFMQLHHFQHPFFAAVTHAHFMDPYEAWSTWDVEGMRMLTHLALNIYDVSLLDDDLLRRIGEILDACSRLEVLVLVDELGYGESAAFELLHDPRVVVLEQRPSFDDWHAIAFGGEDLWTVAEQVVRTQKNCDSQAKR